MYFKIQLKIEGGEIQFDIQGKSESLRQLRSEHFKAYHLYRPRLVLNKMQYCTLYETAVTCFSFRLWLSTDKDGTAFHIT